MGISLQHLEQKKLAVGMNKLREAGIDVEQWLAMLNADPKAMQRLVSAWPGSPTVMSQPPLRPGIVYDATAVSRILGLPVLCKDSVPKAADGEIVIYYGGWSFKELRLCIAGKKRMYTDDKKQVEYMHEKFETKTGYYKLLLPVPRSSGFADREGQIEYLKKIDPTARPAPAIVATTALLVHLAETYEDLLDQDNCRCKESAYEGWSTVISARTGRVNVNQVDERDSDRGCSWLLAAILKI